MHYAVPLPLLSLFFSLHTKNFVMCGLAYFTKNNVVGSHMLLTEHYLLHTFGALNANLSKVANINCTLLMIIIVR